MQSYKSTNLNLKDLNNSIISPLLQEIIEEYKKNNLIEDKDIRILDWGCGRGKTVFKLLELSYDAFGVELDSELVEKSKNTLTLINADTNRINKIDGFNTNFEDNYFDIIITEDVIEHIEHLELFYKECSRILKLGGLSYNRFPAKYNIREVHLLMPFLHWFPKNNIRKFLIYIYIFIRQEPFWNVNDKVNVYFNYSIKKTFYRDLFLHKKYFKRFSLDYKYVVKNNPRLASFLSKYCLNNIFTRFILQHISIRFFTVQILLKKINE